MRPKRRAGPDVVPNQPMPARIFGEVDENEVEDNNEPEEEEILMEENAGVVVVEPTVSQAWVIVDPTQIVDENDETLKAQKEDDTDKQLLEIARQRWTEESCWTFKGDKMPLAKTKSLCQIPGQREEKSAPQSTMIAFAESTFKKIHNYTLRGKLPEEFYGSVVIGHPLKIHKNFQRSEHRSDSVVFMDLSCTYTPERMGNRLRDGVMRTPRFMLLTVNFSSNSAAEVHWALNDTRIMNSNKVIETKLEAGESPNHYRSTIKINTENVNCAGIYYILIMNKSKFRWTRFNIGFEKFNGPNLDGNVFSVTGSPLTHTICGVKLQNVIPKKYEVEWKLDGQYLDAKKFGVTTTTEHSEFPSGRYAVMEIPQHASLPKGEYTCIVTNEKGSREIRLDPFANTHFDTVLISSPDFTGRLYQHSSTYMMKIEFEIIVKYRACYPIHATAWTKHGDLFQHNARFSNFKEQRVRIGPDAYASILTFECLKRPHNPPIDRVWFRFCVMCVGGNQEGTVEIRFDWSLSEMVDQHYASMPTTGWDAVKLIEQPPASLL